MALNEAQLSEIRKNFHEGLDLLSEGDNVLVNEEGRTKRAYVAYRQKEIIQRLHQMLDILYSEVKGDGNSGKAHSG